MQPGRTLCDRYVLERELGRSPAGVVFAGHDRLLEREVEIRVIVLRDDPAHELQIRRAAERIAQLEHPGVIPIHQFGRERELAFVVTPRVRGRSLRSLIDAGPLAIPTVAEIGRQVALALAYCHVRGVFHADLRPGAIRVSDEPSGVCVQLGEFGLDDSSSPSDARADLYALGAVLYECVGGRPPSEHHPPVRPGLQRELPRELEALILTLLSKQPARRPSNAREVAERLEPHADRRAPTTGLAVTFGLADPSGPALHELVGRDRTLRAIDLRLTAARAGAFQLILLAGDPGVGKTAVLDELAVVCQRREIDLLRTRATSDGPERGQVRACLSELLTAGLAQRPEAIELLTPIASRLIASFPELGRTRLGQHAQAPRREPSWAELAPLDARSSFAEAVATSAPQTRHEDREHQLVVRAFAALVASGRPLAMAIDDAHLDPELVCAIERLFRRLPQAPLVLILAHPRAGVAGEHPLARLRRGIAHHPRALTLELGPLADDVHAALLVQLLGGGQLDPRLAGRLRRESGGWPLLARELVRAAVEAGVLVQRDGVWRLDAPRWPIARSVRTLLERRLGELPAATLAALQIGAVIAIADDSFEPEPVAELLGLSVIELDQRLASARERALIVDAHPTSSTIRFTSEVLRRVVHDGLPLPDRRKLHRHCAERLRRLASGPGSSELDAERHEVAITRHLIHAEAVSDARPLVIGLAHDALDERRPEPALTLLIDLLELADGLPPVERGELQLLVAELERVRAELPAAIAALEQLAITLGHGDDARLTRLGERGAELANQLDRRDLADRLLGLRPRDRRAAERQRRARAELAALRPATSSRSMQVGDLLLMHGEYTAAREAYDTARRRAAAEGDFDEEARQLQRLARVASRLGHHETAIGYCRDGLALLSDRSSVERVGLRALAGFVHVVAGQVERAAVELEAGAAELATVSRDPGVKAPRGPGSSDRDRVAAELERSRGNYELALGHAASAIAAYERCLALIPANERWTLSIARFNLGQACALAGHASRALRELERAAADKRAIGDREGLAYTQLVRVQVSRDLGQIADAAEWLVEARELADEIEHPSLSAQVQAEFGRHALLGGKLELATQAARTAMDLARSSHAAAELGAALELLATIDLARGDRDEAVRHASKALATADERSLASLQLPALLILAEARAPEHSRELLDRARAASERTANPYRELDVSLTSLRLGLGDPLHAGDDYVALEQLSARAEALGAKRHVGLCLIAQAEVLAPHDPRGALDHARLGEAQLRILGARLEADRAGELIASLTLR